MFRYEEFLKFYDDKVQPELAKSSYLLTVDDIHRFDTDIEDFEASCKQSWRPEEYAKESEIFKDWQNAMLAQSECTCRLHFYYGMGLFLRGAEPLELNSMEEIPHKKLKQIPEYAAVADMAIEVAFEALRICEGDTKYISLWYKRNLKLTELRAKAFIRAGYLAAQREAEIAGRMEKLVSESD